MTRSDPGFDANLSVLLAAHLAKSEVIAHGYPHKRWAGSTGKYCLLYAIELF
ncbi:hypothetical protein PRUB_a3770 [Pseudoalteromonas rubra]|uniref:Uncharacterized protein n=2 Tax=Pseudoalteromonas rubra TaxID=43658 RepID=A0A8T0CAD4_9GAMM|nr:hypothetical protein PRUB_a3770 [Pseudoalteromonas rubra]